MNRLCLECGKRDVASVLRNTEVINCYLCRAAATGFVPAGALVIISLLYSPAVISWLSFVETYDTVFESPLQTCYSLLRGRARYVIMTANLGGQYGEARKLPSKPFCGVEGACNLVTSRSRIKSKQASACRPLVVDQA